MIVESLEQINRPAEEGMIDDGVVRTSCGLCSVGCGVLVHMKDGKPSLIEGDPENLKTRGAICPKGLASLELLSHPDRLKHPLKRTGERGEGRFKEISWDEALSITARELQKTKNDHGAETVAIIRGAAKGMHDSLLQRFAFAFGTPNLVSPAHVCFVPRALASRMTYGSLAVADYDYPPACIIAWGANAARTNIDEHERIVSTLNSGTRLIVIDPIEIDLVKRSDLWLRLRPGSDLALALGMINTIINENLFDREFIENWTVGFEELKDHIQDYPPEKMQEITWIESEMIKKAARFFASNGPACIQWGNGLEQNLNTFQSCRAITILRALTGNLGVPGGEVFWSPPSLLNLKVPAFTLQDKMPAGLRRLGISEVNNFLPYGFVPPEAAIRTLIEADPYPIYAAYVQGANPLLTYSNSNEVYRALNKLNFLAVAELFMTPTAALADIVLPAASYLEYDSLTAPANFPIVQVQQKVAEVGQCRSDMKILNKLAGKLGLGEYFWSEEESYLDAILKPSGLKFKKFKEISALLGTKKYGKHEKDGFDTPSGKVELYSKQLEKSGFDPMPVYYEPPETPYSAPDLAKQYPLIFTNNKSAYYRHSMGRQINTLREGHPDPIISLHPETAGQLGIKDGDWVYIETERGRIKQKATLIESIDPRVVLVDYGWWFPERGISDLFGWEESNINLLTDDKPPYSPEMGSANLRGRLCKVYKESEGVQ